MVGIRGMLPLMDFRKVLSYMGVLKVESRKAVLCWPHHASYPSYPSIQRFSPCATQNTLEPRRCRVAARARDRRAISARARRSTRLDYLQVRDQLRVMRRLFRRFLWTIIGVRGGSASAGSPPARRKRNCQGRQRNIGSRYSGMNDYVCFLPSASSSRRIKAADERQALARAANIVTHRAKTKHKAQTALLCRAVETPSASAPFVLLPVAYVTADAQGVLNGSGANLDRGAYIAELQLACNYAPRVPS